VTAEVEVAWWREPTKTQWYAFVAAWLGWTLDAFDFTIFLLIMVPISQEFGVPLTAVTMVFAVTLWLRLVGATAAGWLADRVGRKNPLIISILWYSVCNAVAGLSPTFGFLLLWRALLGIGMGAEWATGAVLAMESWPPRSRGFMSGILHGSWGIGFALSATAYALLFDHVGWRGLLIIGVFPALACVWIRFYVQEPDVWSDNKRRQDETRQRPDMPLRTIFSARLRGNTISACFWVASGFCAYYSTWALFQTYLRTQLNWTPRQIWWPLFWANIIVVVGSAIWGYVADIWGRRPAIIIPAGIAFFLTPLYLLPVNFYVVTTFFVLQGLFGGSIYSQNPSYLSERFPTDVRATASGFVFHQGTIVGGLMVPVLTYFAVDRHYGFAIPMLVGTMVSLTLVIIAVSQGPETKGKALTAGVQGPL